MLLIFNEFNCVVGDQNGLFLATCHVQIFSDIPKNIQVLFDIPKKYSNTIRYTKKLFKYCSIYQKNIQILVDIPKTYSNTNR